MLMRILGKFFKSNDETNQVNVQVKGSSKSTLTEAEYLIEVDEQDMFYKEWLDDKGGIVRAVLQDKNGDVNDPELMREVQAAVIEWIKNQEKNEQ